MSSAPRHLERDAPPRGEGVTISRGRRRRSSSIEGLRIAMACRRRLQSACRSVVRLWAPPFRCRQKYRLSDGGQPPCATGQRKLTREFADARRRFLLAAGTIFRQRDEFCVSRILMNSAGVAMGEPAARLVVSERLLPRKSRRHGRATTRSSADRRRLPCHGPAMLRLPSSTRPKTRTSGRMRARSTAPPVLPGAALPQG